MKKIFKYVYQLFITINLYESSKKNKKIKKKGVSFFLIKSFKQAKSNKQFKIYFKKYKFKFKRLKNKSKFIGLKNKNKLICSGWIYFGVNCKWNIEEIDKKISLKGEYLLYDFETEKQFRNKGYYQLLLKVIQNKFKSKKLIIYALSHNPISNRAIQKAGFKFRNKLRKY
jgi:hypothetical protein